jgi:hypothetical protein
MWSTLTVLLMSLTLHIFGSIPYEVVPTEIRKTRSADAAGHLQRLGQRLKKSFGVISMVGKFKFDIGITSKVGDAGLGYG